MEDMADTSTSVFCVKLGKFVQCWQFGCYDQNVKNTVIPRFLRHTRIMTFRSDNLLYKDILPKANS